MRAGLLPARQRPSQPLGRTGLESRPVSALDPLSDEQREIRELVRDARARADRAARRRDRQERPSSRGTSSSSSARTTLFGVMFDEEYGGIGASALMTLVTIEELSKVCATSGLIIAVQELGSLGIKLAGTDEQKQRFLPEARERRVARRLRADRARLAAPTAAAMRTTARRDGDEYVLERRQALHHERGRRAVYVVFAKTDPDARARGHLGVRRRGGHAGLRGRPHRAEDGDQGLDDRRGLLQRLPRSRRRTCSARRARASGSRCASSTARGPGIGAQGLGLAQGATDYALEYARSRETMGKPIAQHQLIAGMLADMETRCEAARGLLYKVGQHDRRGRRPAPELTKLSAMAKLYCTDVAMEVTTDAVQVLGGYGYIQEYPVERMMRDAKITQIYEGTNQIQRLVIAREMLKENARSCCRRRLTRASDRRDRARGQAVERRPRPLPGRRDHEGRPLRLLRAGRRRDRAAPARPAVHDEALARGARRAARSSRSRRRRACPTGSRRGSSARGRAAARASRGSSTSRSSTRREALLWMVQMHCIDMNAWYSRVDKPDRPDFVLFDLDPPEEDDAFALCVRVAHYLRDGARRARARVVREDERRRRDPRPRPDRAALDVRGHLRVRGAALAAARGASIPAR